VVADSLYCLKFEVKMSWTLERPRRGLLEWVGEYEREA
jgi:hypothetical protein